MARTKAELLKERESARKSEWHKGHQEYLKNTNTFRKYGGTPDSQGKVYDLERNPRGKALARKINSPKAKLKRSLRHDRYEGHENSFTTRALAELTHKK